MPDYPILDRQVHFDDASRNYGIMRQLGAPRKLNKRIWKPGLSPLDQGREGQCVIFGWGAELAASPHRYEIDSQWCRLHWPLVQAKDREMGNDFSDGASVLAGAKTMQMLGNVKSYYWGFGINDVLQTLSRRGPVILGINWYASMYETDELGLVTVEGNRVGGHCILANGIWPNHPLFKEDVVVWTNSWGSDYGINGRGYIPVESLSRLLREDGEACIPTDRPVRTHKVEPYDGD
jgi:hypothetical protein